MIPHERVGFGGETSFSNENVVCVRCALNGFNPLETVSLQDQLVVDPLAFGIT